MCGTPLQRPPSHPDNNIHMQGPRTDDTQKLFNSIAPTYDSLNHWLSLGIDRTWRRRSLRHIVDKSRPQQILDIACGTGDYSLTIARHSHPDTRVQGIDLTEALFSTLLFETPYVVLCKPDCKGLCPHCGANLNEGDCGCAERVEQERALSPDNPFAVLSQLKFDD